MDVDAAVAVVVVVVVALRCPCVECSMLLPGPLSMILAPRKGTVVLCMMFSSVFQIHQ